MRANHDLLREYAQLNRRRKDDGITPLEFQRWLDLRKRLERAFPDKPALGLGGDTRICVEFASLVALAKAVMMNLRPVGLFVPTPFAPEEGPRFELRVTVRDTREVFDSPVVVVFQNVGPEFSTTALGMGVRFTRSMCPLRARLEELCGVQAPPDAREGSGERAAVRTPDRRTAES